MPQLRRKADKTKPGNEKVEHIIRDVFHKVQFNKTCHQKQMSQMRKCLEESRLAEFWEHFIGCLRLPLLVAEKHPHVENTLSFVSNFAVSLDDFQNNDRQMCPFLRRLFDFLLEWHVAANPAIRFRCCHLLNLLLNSMGENAEIDDDYCDRITVAMMDRLMDRSPRVRAQAVFSLYRLQDPQDPDCSVIKTMLFHLVKDPSAEVRKAVLSVLARTPACVQAVVKKTRDVNEQVRKKAFEYISKVTLRSLTIRWREQIVKDGLKDKSEMVRMAVSNVLLPAWLRFCKGDYVALLAAFDVEFGKEAANLMLDALFKQSDLKSLIDSLPLDPGSKLIPPDKLTSENALLWCRLAKHLKEHGCESEHERIVPELSILCNYIRDCLKHFAAQGNPAATFIQTELVEITKVHDLSDEVGRGALKQLLLDLLLTECNYEEIVGYLENVMPDVNARIEALSLVIGELRSPIRQTCETQSTTAMMTTQMSQEQRHEINMQKARLQVELMDLEEQEYQAKQRKEYLKADEANRMIVEKRKEIAELCRPQETVVEEEVEVRNDPETMVKCLRIMCSMMAATSIKTLTPTLRSMIDNIVLLNLADGNEEVQLLSLKMLGICCTMDSQLAKDHLLTFCMLFSIEQENPELWRIALWTIFDLLALFGFEFFDIEHSDEDVSHANRSKSRTGRLYSANDEESSLVSTTQPEMDSGQGKLVQILMNLLDHTNVELRTLAAEGLCKLLLQGRLNGPGLLSRLIIVWHNPVNADAHYLRQCLYTFFHLFVGEVPEGRETLESAFTLTLQTLANAPDVSPLREIDGVEVARMILCLTCDNGTSSTGAAVHDNLAMKILAELLNPATKMDLDVLAASLQFIRPSLDDPVVINNLQEAVDKAVPILNANKKFLVKHLEDFKSRLTEPETQPTNETGTQNELSANPGI